MAPWLQARCGGPRGKTWILRGRAVGMSLGGGVDYGNGCGAFGSLLQACMSTVSRVASTALDVGMAVPSGQSRSPGYDCDTPKHGIGICFSWKTVYALHLVRGSYPEHGTYSCVAQLAEHPTVNRTVTGSSPVAGAMETPDSSGVSSFSADLEFPAHAAQRGETPTAVKGNKLKQTDILAYDPDSRLRMKSGIADNMGYGASWAARKPQIGVRAQTPACQTPCRDRMPLCLFGRGTLFVANLCGSGRDLCNWMANPQSAGEPAQSGQQPAQFCPQPAQFKPQPAHRGAERSPPQGVGACTPYSEKPGIPRKPPTLPHPAQAGLHDPHAQVRHRTAQVQVPIAQVRHRTAQVRVPIAQVHDQTVQVHDQTAQVPRKIAPVRVRIPIALSADRTLPVRVRPGSSPSGYSRTSTAIRLRDSITRRSRESGDCSGLVCHASA